MVLDCNKFQTGRYCYDANNSLTNSFLSFREGEHLIFCLVDCYFLSSREKAIVCLCSLHGLMNSEVGSDVMMYTDPLEISLHIHVYVYRRSNYCCFFFFTGVTACEC